MPPVLLARQHAILALAKEAGRVTVEQLAARFEVTPQTIRRDLNELCDRRLLTRVHGGAMLASGVENVGYEARRLAAQDEKRAIGRAAAALIPSGSSLFINIGTTTEAVAQALLQHEGLLVITNNTNVAALMRPYPGIEVIIAGGVVRRSDGGIVGEAAVEFIRGFKVDWAVIGTSAIDPDGSFLDYDYREVKVSQAIIQNARQVMLVSDRSKFERSAPVRVGHMAQLHSFVTDACPSEAVREMIRGHGVALVEAQADAMDGDEPAGLAQAV